MNPITVSSIVLILLHSTISAYASGKITPVAVDSQSNGKSDLKTEEARFRDPAMPEYYDRDRQGFITSNYGGSSSPYERYGYNNNFDRIAANYYATRFPGGYDSRERFGNSPQPITGNSFIDSKLNYLSGYGSKFPYSSGSGSGSAVFGPYGSPSYGSQGSLGGALGGSIGSIGGSPLGGMHGGHGALGGILPPELEAKASVLLPLAGAALLGIAAYALVTGPGIAAVGPVIGKRRRRSVFDEAVEKHLAYRAHKQNSQKH